MDHYTLRLDDSLAGIFTSIGEDGFHMNIDLDDQTVEIIVEPDVVDFFVDAMAGNLDMIREYRAEADES